MGNIMHESFFSPTNANDQYNNGEYNKIQDTNYDFESDKAGNVAYGLIQWKNVSRRTDLSNIAENMGLLVSNINAQLACIRYECETSCSAAFNSVKNSGNVDTATQICKDGIEICNDNSLSLRTNYANIIYNALRTE